MRRPNRVFAALLACTLWLPAAVAQSSADSFYEQRLRDGALALERGRLEQAVRDLRLAAFGFLEQPDRLLESLTRLALAEDAAGDGLAFDQTFQRIQDLEESRGWYREADLPADLRQRFEARVATVVPLETLRQSQAFSHLARQRLTAGIEELPPRQRRERLTRLIAEEPTSDRWPLLLARLELQQKRPQQAVVLASSILNRTPTEQGALCVRGIAHSRLGSCAAAVPDLAACERSRLDLPIAYAHVDCLRQLERWKEAQGALQALPQNIQGDRSFNRLRRQIEREVAKLPAPVPDAVPPTRELEVAATLTTSDRQLLDQARQALAEARTASDLTEASLLAADVADRNPAIAEAQLLAGEIFYRASRWNEASRYFQRAGDPPEDRHGLLFYMAVSYFEAGQAAAARQALERALPNLKRTPFVETYIERILGSGGGDSSSAIE
ncbi:MAG: hypothetical protein AAF604_05795 [Acidobacteriota bacterium]